MGADRPPCSGKPGPKGDAGTARALAQGVRLRRQPLVWQAVSQGQGPSGASSQEHKEVTAEAGLETVRVREGPCWDGLLIQCGSHPGGRVRDGAGDQHSYSVTKAGTDSPRDELKWGPGPVGGGSGEGGQTETGPVVLLGSDRRLSKSGLDKCKGLAS